MKGTTLQKRIVSGTTFGALAILMANYMPPIGAWLVVMAMAAVGQHEYYRMVRAAGLTVYPVLGLLCGAGLTSVTFWGEAIPGRGGSLYELSICVSLLLVFSRQFANSNDPQPLRTVALTLLGFFYVPFLFNYISRLAFSWGEAGDPMTMGATGRVVVLYFLCVVKFQDIGAYFTGCAIGKHKAFPKLSPKKTWEGVGGGIVTSLVVSLAFHFICKGALGTIPLRLGDALALGVLLPVCGIVGDLFESLIKRATNTKDSGSFIPGMGGLLDVLDSLLFAAPVLYLYIRLRLGA